jgi:hypothetical protein
MVTKVINIPYADSSEAEKQVNDILKNVTNFSGIKIVNNGCNSMLMVFMNDHADDQEVTDNDNENQDATEDEGESTGEVIPQVKIVEFSLTETSETEKIVNEALKDIEPITMDVITPFDGNRLIIVYNSAE